MNVLIVSKRKALWDALIPAFAENGLTPVFAQTPEKGLDVVRAEAPVLVVFDLDEDAADDADKHVKNAKTAIGGILAANAAVHTAVVSFLPDDVFHEATEGLGVLCSLPSKPQKEDVDKLAEALRTVGAV